MSDIYQDLYQASYSYSSVPSKVKVKSVFAMSFNGIDFITDLVSFSLTSTRLDSNKTTFGKYSVGRNVKWNLKVKSIFDGGSNESLHGWLWNNAAQTVPFIIRPFEEFEPLEKRFYHGQVRVPHRPDIKVASGKVSTFDYNFTVIGQPSRTDRPGNLMTNRIYDEF